MVLNTFFKTKTVNFSSEKDALGYLGSEEKYALHRMAV